MLKAAIINSACERRPAGPIYYNYSEMPTVVLYSHDLLQCVRKA